MYIRHYTPSFTRDWRLRHFASVSIYITRHAWDRGSVPGCASLNLGRQRFIKFIFMSAFGNYLSSFVEYILLVCFLNKKIFFEAFVCNGLLVHLDIGWDILKQTNLWEMDYHFSLNSKHVSKIQSHSNISRHGMISGGC